MRRTKIVATIGPASSDAKILRKMIGAGLDVARLNFSHGTHADHERSFRRIKKLGARVGKSIGVIADLQGPKIRVGEIEGASLELRKGDELTITTRKIRGSGGKTKKNSGARVSTIYGRLHRDVSPGSRILMRDGSIEVKVVEIDGRDIHCRVIFGGELTSHAGMNLPDINISEPSLTSKDRDDARFAAALGVDYFALSFVRSPRDIVRLKKLLKKLGSSARVIAKIEKPEAVELIDEIISAADGIMIARGDLGVEMPPEKVPQLQKNIIARCVEAGKPVITATQMLESMISRAIPTRAEASDVVNAIYDGTDAVMLSGETAVGANPTRVIRMMARIAREADEYLSGSLAENRMRRLRRTGAKEKVFRFEDAIGQAVQTAASSLRDPLIVCFTSSGFTALQASSYRPDVPIIGATHRENVLPLMSLYWGVQPILTPAAETVDAMIGNIERELLKRRMARKGAEIIITTGYPLGVSGTTNMMQLIRVGEHCSNPAAGAAKRGKRG